MVRLQNLGLEEVKPKSESVAILVGPNGSGKSSALLELSKNHSRRRKVFIICNTSHDRFSGSRGIPRLSVGNWRQTPKAIVKGAVADALSTESSAFYQISSILEYCSYQPRFGFTIVPHFNFNEVWSDPEYLWERYLNLRRTRSNLPRLQEGEFSAAIAFLARQDPRRPLWVDATGHVLEFSQSREFAYLLRFERLLRDMDLIAGINVFLRRRDAGQDVEMKNASSGQLALISSLLYLITNVTVDDPVIIVDEPENSLHPKWQQEYIDKLLAALRYRNATIVIATHAPLIVTGALATNREIVSVFELRNGEAKRLNIEATSSVGSIEEILWRAFDVVTPANHFVSEQIVEAISSFERGEIAKGDVLDFIEDLDGRSFDVRQKRYFQTVRGLLDEVDAALDNGGDDA